jgi:hypothetical protein
MDVNAQGPRFRSHCEGELSNATPLKRSGNHGNELRGEPRKVLGYGVGLRQQLGIYTLPWCSRSSFYFNLPFSSMYDNI